MSEKRRGRPRTVGIERRAGIMLCYPFEEKRFNKWNVPYVITQPKLDGERCRAICLMNSVTLYSSECNEILSMPHISAELSSLNLMGEFDGELYHHGLDFSSIHSRVGRTKSLHEKADQIEFHIFDIADESLRQTHRTSLLENMRKLDSCQYIKKVPTSIATSLEEITTQLSSFVEDGYEGIIVRHPEGLYRRKRSTDIMKFKPGKSDIYTIIGANEEIDKDGIPKNTLGSFICCSSECIPFSVGSGFTHQQRKEFWQNLPQFIGAEIEVNYQVLTEKRIPRFPIFCRIIGASDET